MAHNTVSFALELRDHEAADDRPRSKAISCSQSYAPRTARRARYQNQKLTRLGSPFRPNREDFGRRAGRDSARECKEDGDRVVVRRAGTHTSEELHAVLFPTGAPARRSLADLKDGIRRAVRERYARR